MASNFMKMARKLQGAINIKFGINLLLNTNQWYHNDKKMFINVYSVKQSVFDEEKHKNVVTELFVTYSQIQLVLFMRDLWYELNGWQLPTDNPIWEELKLTYKATKKPSDADVVVKEEPLNIDVKWNN